MRVFVALVNVAALIATGRAKIALSSNGERASAEHTKNPVRRVITLLENMAKKVASEGKAEEDLYNKFMCYCTGTTGEIAQGISEGQTKMPQLQTNIEEAQESLASIKLELKTAQDDRAKAKQAIAEATEVREKENKAFVDASTEKKTYVEGLGKAIGAIEKGVAGGALLQASTGAQLRRAVAASSATEYDKKSVVDFLQGGAAQGGGYVPASGEVTGILKQMKEDFEADLADLTATEKKSLATFGELSAAKAKQVTVLGAAIETKIARVGQLQMDIVSMKQDLTGTQKALAEDLKFAANLKENCDGKKSEWEERKKLRAEELVAVHDTIKILSDDDALELFKKTLPSPSLLQLEANSRMVRQRALGLVGMARRGAASDKTLAESTRLDFLALALQGRDFSFAKVIAMIDGMVKLLADEQNDDENKKEYCGHELDRAEDKAKALASRSEDLTVSLDDAAESMDVLTKELAELAKGVKDLDKSVEQAAEQRKSENAEYKELMSSNAAAKELLNFAKNRLNKFYSPKLYKAPAKVERSADQAIADSMGGGAALVQIDQRAGAQQKETPPPPPETWGAYSKKGEETTGAVAMIDLLVKDLDKEMTEADVEEKNAQKAYEEMMTDSAAKRAADLKSINTKTKAKTNMEAQAEADKVSLKSTQKELMATKAYEISLHAECDWLVQYFDIRKEARAQETENLKAAKAILSGADYSLAQAQPDAGSPRGA